MSRTVRRHDFRTKRWARQEVEGQHFCGRVYPFEENSDSSQRQTLAILRGDDGRMSYDKCQTAAIDSEGGYKLNTWSECPNKNHGKEAKRKLRKAGKILAQRQLEDY